MKRVRFSARYPSDLLHPLHGRVVERPGVSRADLLTWTPTADATTLLWVDGDEADAASLVDAVGSADAHSLVGGPDGTYAFLHQREYEFPAAVMDLVADSRVVFLPPVTFLATGAIEFEAVGEPDSLAAFYADLTDLADASIDRVRPFRRHRPGGAAAPVTDLTDRQRRALTAAADSGYYDVPRNGSVADVAEALECSTSTAGELLRRAESALVGAVTDPEPAEQASLRRFDP